MSNEELARGFMDWYAANMDNLKFYVKDFDEDLFTDAFLRAYNAILRRGTVVNDYTGYFIQTYRATFLDSKRVEKYDYTIDQYLENTTSTDTPYSEKYEEEVATINGEVLEYVRAHFDPYSTSLFEIYLGLSPEISYAKLSALLGISEHKIRHRIRPIRKSLTAVFGPALTALN